MIISVCFDPSSAAMAAVLRDNPSYHGYISLQVLGHMQQEDTGARAAVLGGTAPAPPNSASLCHSSLPCPACTSHPSPASRWKIRRAGNPKFAAAFQLGMRDLKVKRQKYLYLVFVGADSRSLSHSPGKETPTLLSQGESLHPSALLPQEEGLKQKIQIYSKKALGS